MKKQKRAKAALFRFIVCIMTLWSITSSITALVKSISAINELETAKYEESSAIVKLTPSSKAPNEASSIKNSVTPQLLEPRNKIEIPILMYHSITDDESKESEYVITDNRFESDLRFLAQNGFTSVFPIEIASYIKNGTKLPSKPILITFDDGYSNNMVYALPLLQKYNMKATISVVGKHALQSSDDIYRIADNGSLTLGEIALLANSEHITFGNHSYDMHKVSKMRKGANMAAGESLSAYKITLAADAEKNQLLLEKTTGTKPILYAWPYGARPADFTGDKILQKIGIPITCGSYQSCSTISKGNPDSLLGLGRYLRTPDFDMSILLN